MTNSMSVNESLHSFARSVALLLAVALIGSLGVDRAAHAQDVTEEQFQELQQTFERARDAAQANNQDQAYDLLTEAHDMAVELGQQGARETIGDFLERLPRQWGNEALEAEDYEEAIEHFEKGMEHAPNNAYMPYGKGLALFNLDRDEEAVEAMIESIEIAQEVGDGSQLATTENRLHDHYIARASSLLAADSPTSEDANQALSFLDDLTDHMNPTPDYYFYRASALFELGNYNEAISAAEQGLQIFDGSASDEARYHFIAAESHFELGNVNQACATYENAAFGDFQGRAEHMLEHECD